MNSRSLTYWVVDLFMSFLFYIGLIVMVFLMFLMPTPTQATFFYVLKNSISICVIVFGLIPVLLWKKGKLSRTKQLISGMFPSSLIAFWMSYYNLIGACLFLIDVILNTIVVIANHGIMPVKGNYELKEFKKSKRHTFASEQTRLNWLADQDFLGNSSIGDLMMAVSFWVVIIEILV